ncbi:hypothetical protein AWRI3579_g962 [Hanseniaspora osmophila]|uniref:GATA-type domain-containing protein n=1 Tax=Hanseniaspora osmophila TaxID=56408 RepID=A0A1E5RP40_9ASCO|nr:hypothetical protein AWRI3579_g962 [Hanseniaspora osmophila]
MPPDTDATLKFNLAQSPKLVLLLPDIKDPANGPLASNKPPTFKKSPRNSITLEMTRSELSVHSPDLRCRLLKRCSSDLGTQFSFKEQTTSVRSSHSCLVAPSSSHYTNTSFSSSSGSSGTLLRDKYSLSSSTSSLASIDRILSTSSPCRPEKIRPNYKSSKDELNSETEKHKCLNSKQNMLKLKVHKKNAPKPKQIRTHGLCLHCGPAATAEWRQGPYGLRSLCNSCGTYYNKLVNTIIALFNCSRNEAIRKANLVMYYMKYKLKRTDRESRKAIKALPYDAKWEDKVREVVPFKMDKDFFVITEKSHDKNGIRKVRTRNSKSSEDEISGLK